MRCLKWLLLLFVALSLVTLASCEEEVKAAEDASSPPSEEGGEEEEEEVATPSRDGLSEDERKAVDESQETFEFQAEVSRLMDIIINSLYSNREIFLRELISNSADANDKIRFLSLTDENAMKKDEELKIRIKFDREHKTITLRDNGVGMTKNDLKNNLGVVAKSGTTEFLEAAAKGGDSMSLIGQFGVGFYSVYLVADKVSVVSKHNDDDQHIWESTANSVFTIAKDPRGNTLGRGTEITLHLKEDAEEFLDEDTLSKLVGRYSQFINFPIELWTTKTVSKDVPKPKKDAEPAETEEAEKKDEEDLDVSEEEDNDAPEMETVTETVNEWKRLNDAKPIWTRNPKDVTEEEYHEFYTSLTKDPTPPLDYIHFVAEGEITFRAILYIPGKADHQLYDKYYEKMNGLKLYVRRVLISDEFEEFLPRYMNFIKGIVDSDDLPLNVSRETLAQSRVLKVMAKKLARKVLEMLKKMEERSQDELDKDEEAEDGEDGEEKAVVNQMDTDFYKFYSQYSKSLKMGVMDDRKNKSKLLKLLRYRTSKSDDKYVSLEEYVDRMPEDQKKIYFLCGESMKQITESPAVEKFSKLGYEILYMPEPVDEYCAQHIHEFDGIEPANIARESASITPSKAYKAKREGLTDLTEWFTKTLGNLVSNVIVSNRLVKSPAMLTVTEYGWTGNMERINKAQSFQGNEALQQSNIPKKIFEYNPWHPIITEIDKRRTENPDDAELKDMALILFDNAAVVSGFTLTDADDFAQRINKVVALGLDVDPNAEVPEEEPEEEEEEAPAEEEEAAEAEAEEKSEAEDEE